MARWRSTCWTATRTRSWSRTATGGWWARHQVGGARAGLRDRLGVIRQVANGPGGVDALDDLDVEPYRPRHEGLWQSW